MKLSGKIIFIIVIAIFAGILVGCEAGKNETTNKTSVEKGNQVIDTTPEESNILNIDQITIEEKVDIQEYINIVCNRGRFIRLPEFNDINNANKDWIYSHIDREKYITYATEKEINQNLKSVFGDELVIDVKNDQKLILKDTISYIPTYDETTGKYFLPAFGMDYRILYTIDFIKKENNNYIVNVIEYCEQRDYENNSDNYLAVYTCDEKEPSKWKKIFEKEGNQSGTDKEVINKVLERKKDFQTYNITLIKKNENIYLKEIEKVEK